MGPVTLGLIILMTVVGVMYVLRRRNRIGRKSS